MKKYEELENNAYVREVNNLVTLYDASKMLGISNKELKKFVVTEQMQTNRVIKDAFDKLFGANIIPEVQQAYYLEQLDCIPNLGYTVSVLDNIFPNLKKNPALLLQSILENNIDKIKELDSITMSNNEEITDTALVGYVSHFASDYGISSKKMYNFITDAQKKNRSVFNRMLDLYKKLNFSKSKPEDNTLKELRKVSNLDYVVASLIYNFPYLTSSTDEFFTAIIKSKENGIEKADLNEIEDENIKSFIESKKEYYFGERVK